MPTTSQGNPHAFASLMRLRPYVRPYRGQLVVMMVAGLVATLVGVAVPVLTKRVIDGPIAHGDRGSLWLIGLYALLFGLAETVLVYLRRWTVVRCSLGLETDIRRDFYRHLQRLHVGFHDSWQSGQLVSRISSDISAVRRFVGFGLVFLVINGMTIGIVGALLIVIDPLVGALVIAAGVPLVIAMHHYERLYKKQVRAVQDQVGELATDVEESALGFRTIKAFGRRAHVFGRYDEKAIELYGRQMTLIGTLALLWAVVLGHPFVVLGMVALLGAVAVAHGVLTLGTLVAFVALYMLLAWPIESMGWLLANAQEANSAAERVFEVLDAVPSIADLPAARDREPSGGVSLVLDRVSFTYPGAAQPILRDLELAVAPGETVAVVGPTGCGKTTLTALVSRLYDVSSGAVRLDGVDVRDFPLARLRSIVACAFEDPTLFSVSVRENLTLGRPDAGDDEVAEALRIAQAEFCYDLPWGLDTRVGEQGLTLSGGQRQRLALARAVLGRPPVLVLDDPLSALDVHTEGLVEEALRRVLAGTTGLVVAHRPSTVLLADRVALIGPHPDGGMTITAVGRHDDLLAGNPEYRDILSQSSDLESELTAGGGR